MNLIVKELKHHLPFTVFGALMGLVFLMVFQKTPADVAYKLFYTFHPLHVFLSALVTSSLYKLHVCGRGPHIKGQCNLWMLFAIGYLGSVGISTISDSLIPYLGEVLLNMPHRRVHIGFIEEWWLVNPLAILGIFVAYKWPATTFPHAGHVLISTWASLFHMLMAGGGRLDPIMYLMIFIFLFIAVWIPCCISDIVFPLLFVKDRKSG